MVNAVALDVVFISKEAAKSKSIAQKMWLGEIKWGSTRENMSSVVCLQPKLS